VSEKTPATWVGRSIERREDERFITGAGTYLDDLTLPGTLHAAMLRSPHAHARVIRVDVEAARRLPGVHAVLTGADVERLSAPVQPLIPIPVAVRQFCLAVGKARYAGEPVAAVAAVDRATAEDACDLIEVEYEPLPAAVDPERALDAESPLLFEELGTNVIWQDTFTYGDVDGAFARAAHVVRERFEIHRYASTPLETFGAIARWESTGVTLWSNDQRPGFASQAVARALDIPQSRLRLVAPDIGGGFGNKRKAPYLVLAALLARVTRRPVKFVEDRRESLLALVHAANGVMDVSLALDADARFLAISVRDVVDEGANLQNPTLHSLLKLSNLTNGYVIPAARFEGQAVLTNKCPSGANRGIGKPFMCFGVERIVDLAARRLGLDRLDLRRRNLVPGAAMPYTTPVGATHDSGDYPATLARALEIAGYEELCAERDAARQSGRWIGIGIASAVEPNTSNLSSYILTTKTTRTSGVGEGAVVRVELDGSARVMVGNIPSGQGYQTVIAQIVADELGLTPDDIAVNAWFDSAVNPWLYGSGNFANKFAGTDTAAIVEAARRVRGKIFQIAAHVTGAPEDTLELRGGAVWIRGAPSPLLPLARVAEVAYRDLLRLPPGIDAGLEARCYHTEREADLPGPDRRLRVQLTYSNSAHIALVEVAPDTGMVKILRYAIAHDCGRELNPRLVEGMVHGATTHGIGATLHEEFAYDDEGQLLTASFMDYLKPTALDVPAFRVAALEHPSPVTALGAKGVGEGGSIPSLAALAGAVEDALSPLGVTVTALPLTPSRVWRLIQEARARASTA
jgi:2-furoyl-CoA dehydrogenase large subunit